MSTPPHAPTELLRAVCSVFAMSRVVRTVTPPGIDVELSAAKPYFRLWSSTLRSGILGVRFLAPSGGSAGCAPLAYHDIASPEVARRLSQLGFRNATKTAVGQSCGCQVAHGEDVQHLVAPPPVDNKPRMPVLCATINTGDDPALPTAAVIVCGTRVEAFVVTPRLVRGSMRHILCAAEPEFADLLFMEANESMARRSVSFERWLEDPFENERRLEIQPRALARCIPPGLRMRVVEMENATEDARGHYRTVVSLLRSDGLGSPRVVRPGQSTLIGIPTDESRRLLEHVGVRVDETVHASTARECWRIFPSAGGAALFVELPSGTCSEGAVSVIVLREGRRLHVLTSFVPAMDFVLRSLTEALHPRDAEPGAVAWYHAIMCYMHANHGSLMDQLKAAK